jgi:hypothetical protein
LRAKLSWKTALVNERDHPPFSWRPFKDPVKHRLDFFLCIFNFLAGLKKPVSARGILCGGR